MPVAKVPVYLSAFGPPIPGAPWILARPAGGAGKPKYPGPGGPLTKLSVKPLLSRVPPGDARRATRFTEILSEIVNSLIMQGYLVKTSDNPPTWTLNIPPTG